MVLVTLEQVESSLIAISNKCLNSIKSLGKIELHGIVRLFPLDMLQKPLESQLEIVSIYLDFCLWLLP